MAEMEISICFSNICFTVEVLHDCTDEDDIVFRAKHPFLYVIRDTSSNTTIFSGRAEQFAKYWRKRNKKRSGFEIN